MTDDALPPSADAPKRKPARAARAPKADKSAPATPAAIDNDRPDTPAAIVPQPPVTESTAPEKTGKIDKPAKNRAPRRKPTAEPDQPELPVAPEAAPRATEPAPSPRPETPDHSPAADSARAPAARPVIQIVGEDTPATVATSRHEAVAFDPSAIFARFAPKPDAAPAPAPEPAVQAPSEAAERASPTTGAEATAGGDESSEPRAGDAPRPDRRDDRGQRDGRREGRDPRHQNGQPGGERRDGRPQNDRRDNGNRPPQQQQGGNREQRPNGERRDGQPGGDRRAQQGGGKSDRPQHQQRKNWPGIADTDTLETGELEFGAAFNYNSLNDEAILAENLALVTGPDAGEPLEFNALYASPINDIVATARNLGLRLHRTPQRRELVGLILAETINHKSPIRLTGTLELLEDGNGLLVYGFDNYKVRELSAFVPRLLIKKHGLLRGHEVEALALPARSGETAPMVVKVNTVMGMDPEEVMRLTPFTELTPYYPTKRILLETENAVGWDNLSMRCVDLLCPIGLGQRGLIVAPPRTGKTVLMQAMANAMSRNYPEAHLIVLLVDERPEEVTDFKRNSRANEVVSSTFDENAESHVHAAEMVIERARRMVEAGRHVIILLDSITRLARAYNTLVPSTGKILSGGVEAGALTRPKRFFGSARNIEGGGSLTILGTALVDTGSKMDEVIFEEFKGTGNMELDLDRDLANKRIFPAINFEKSGTRKEELLYHPDEMAKVYALRRGMKGVPSVEAMEMLITRLKKTKTNSEFLLTLSR